MTYRHDMTEGEARDILHEQLDIVCYQWQQGEMTDQQACQAAAHLFEAWMEDQILHTPKPRG